MHDLRAFSSHSELVKLLQCLSDLFKKKKNAYAMTMFRISRQDGIKHYFPQLKFVRK